MDLIEIKSDLYDISDRIKEVGNYKLYLNLRKERYEIHSPHGLELTLGNRTPTAEVVVRLQKTRIEKIHALLEEIERENMLAENAAQSNLMRKTEQIYGSN
ncbi:MAG: hypothetical protein ACI4MT_02950 [Christensenellales bacterium]